MNSTHEPLLTPELVARHDRPGPRYTSYPTADRFTLLDSETWAKALARADADADAPLSLYFHIPYCERICTYCACTAMASKSPVKKDRYIEHLKVEIERIVAHLPHRRRVTQLHLGGGTPNSLDDAGLTRLIETVRANFDVADDAELSIEADPRLATPAQVHHLARLGFNRLSVGVQDFSPEVQAAIGREQSFEQTESTVKAGRAAGYHSVNVDLVYGLPAQDAARFEHTLECVRALDPDRIALFSFAYVPWAAPNQRKIDTDLLPSPDEKLALFCRARAFFAEAGYRPIGLDHFAKPHDSLSRALEAGTLRRNFQGYSATQTAEAPPEILGFGLSAISEFGGLFAQNHKSLKAYEAALDEGRPPIARGIARTEDDKARGFAIQHIMGVFTLDLAALKAQFGVEAANDWPATWSDLQALEMEGLVALSDARVDVTPLGRLFVRVVAMAFDRHLRERPPQRPAYSRTV